MPAERGAGESNLFYAELDAAKRQASRSCCTVWTLAAGLLIVLVAGLWLIL